jgi:hypothetical protein
MVIMSVYAVEKRISKPLNPDSVAVPNEDLVPNTNQKVVQSSNITAPTIGTIVKADDKCQPILQEKYTWGRWVIVGTVAGLMLLMVLPLFFFVKKQTAWIVVGVMAVLCICWLIFAMMADRMIFSTFKAIFSSFYCKSV